MDSAFRATYAIRQIVFGDFKAATIAFDAYDHYGRPAFERYKFALLFVSLVDGVYYQQKYQFFPVFQLGSGEWAGCGDPYQYEPRVHRGKLVARKLTYGADAFFEISDLSSRDLAARYPAPYYEIKQGKAFCRMGNTVQELFEVKKNGVLKARGLFE